MIKQAKLTRTVKEKQLTLIEPLGDHMERKSQLADFAVVIKQKDGCEQQKITENTQQSSQTVMESEMEPEVATGNMSSVNFNENDQDKTIVAETSQLNESELSVVDVDTDVEGGGNAEDSGDVEGNTGVKKGGAFDVDDDFSLTVSDADGDISPENNTGNPKGNPNSTIRTSVPPGVLGFNDTEPTRTSLPEVLGLNDTESTSTYGLPEVLDLDDTESTRTSVLPEELDDSEWIDCESECDTE